MKEKIIKESIIRIIIIVCSLILIIIGFNYLQDSTVRGLKDALLLLGKYQNVKSDTTDLLDNYLKSSIWTYKIKGILFVILGSVLFMASNPKSLFEKVKGD